MLRDETVHRDRGSDEERGERKRVAGFRAKRCARVIDGGSHIAYRTETNGRISKAVVRLLYFGEVYQNSGGGDDTFIPAFSLSLSLSSYLPTYLPTAWSR